MQLIEDEAEQLRQKLVQIEHIKAELAKTDVSTLNTEEAEKYRTIMLKIEQEDVIEAKQAVDDAEEIIAVLGA